MLQFNRDVPDFTFPNPAGAGFGRIYELKSGWAGAGFEQICKMSMENTAGMNHCNSTTKHKQETLSCSAYNPVRCEIFGPTGW